MSLHDLMYKPRIADELLARELEGMGAVLIKGPKWCGKTTTAEQMAESVIYIDEPENVDQNIRASEINPSQLLDGKTPRLIDEWQIAPKLWDAVRFTIDRRKLDGQFILTGSAVPSDPKQENHSGTGRIAQITMRPMSLWESGDSSGAVSLHELFNDNLSISGINKSDINDIAYYICRGGWPRATLQSRNVSLRRAFDYYDAIVNVDIHRVDNVERSTERTKLLMRSYARIQGAQVPLTTIRDDMRPNDSPSLDERTVYSYIEALKKLFVIEDMPAWNPNLRSKTAIRTSDTRYFVDPSIATASLGIGPESLISDLNTMGLMFETMCIRDLRVYADSLDGTVSHYRDKSGLECDAVIHLRDGSYGLVEIKLGGESLVREGVKNLQALASKIDTGKMKKPSFLMVLTGTGRYAIQRDDGVLEVPVCCLKN